MNAPRPNQTILGIAAASIAEKAQRSGRPQTVVDVVHGRALQHYAEGLRQYLAIALGDLKLASTALLDVRAMATAKGPKEMAAHPGVRARLYRLARDVLGGYRDQAASRSRAGLPWRQPPLGASATEIAAIEDIRTNLDAERREVLDLRYARELALEEIAFVLGIEEEQAAALLRSAEEEARLAIGAYAGNDGALASAVLQAYALQSDEPVSDEEEEASATLEAGVIIGERYKIEKKIGAGAFAQVYLASDTEVPGHQVALKLLYNASLSDWDKERALRELRLIASVFHPSIVQFKDHGWYESRLWFVMPWYEGESLETRIEYEPLSRAEARRIFEPLARALATMHASGLRHQDVKPDNIFLAKIKRYGIDDQEEEILPVLLDLGVAATDAEMVVAGTPNYFAPEVAAQFASKPSGYTISNKADVFSLALSLRNALEPDSEEDIPAGAVETFIEHRATNIPATPVNKDLRHLREPFSRWLSIDPDERPTAEEFAQELQVLTAPEERRAKRIATLKWLVPIALLVATAVGAALFVLNKQKQIERLRADQAEMKTLEVREELGVAEERGKELEEQLQREYESSKLTRKELGQKLARAEGGLRTTRTNLANVRARANKLGSELKASKTRAAELDSALGTAQGTLEQTRRSLARVQTDLSQAQQDYERASTNLRTATQELGAMRTRASKAEQSKADLETRLARSERARQNAETALNDATGEQRRLQREITRLNATIRSLQATARTRASSPTTTPVTPTPTPDPPSNGNGSSRRRRPRR